MVEVEKIIRILDEELLLQNKSYFTLQQANKILLDRRIFQESDIKSKTLKHLLEEQKITNASQTIHEPKQWRIIHSGNTNTSEKDIPLKHIDFSDNQPNEDNPEKDHVFCPECGNSIEIKDDLKTETFLKCPTCLRYFHNPRSHNALFSDSFKSKAKDLFDKHGLKIVIGIVVVILISVLIFRATEKTDRGGDTRILTESETRFEKLKDIATDVIHKNEWCYDQWALLTYLQSAEDSYYGDKSINIDMYPSETMDGGVVITTSKLIIPSPESNAYKHQEYGFPRNIFYRFYFDSKDSITAKYLIVSYDSGHTVNLNFNFRPIDILLNKAVVSSKINKWEDYRKKMAAKQKQKISNSDQMKQIVNISVVCKDELKYINFVYNKLINNVNDLVHQYKTLSDPGFNLYLAEWNLSAKGIKSKYKIEEFNCFFAVNFNSMLSAYQQVGLKFNMGATNYYYITSGIDESYKRILDSYHRK
jgi:DNA-directed RNA polymerase subunit M/transcription elongation factor TFIIS